MTNILISIAFVVVAIWICISGKKIWHRVIFSALMLAWSGFLVFLYMDIMVRLTGLNPPEMPFSKNEFVNGVVAYRNSLLTFKISTMITFFSAALMVVIPAPSKNDNEKRP